MPTAALHAHQAAAREALIAQHGGPLQDIAGQNATQVIIEAAGSIARAEDRSLVIIASSTQENTAGTLGIHEQPNVLRISSPRDIVEHPEVIAGASVAIILDLPEAASGTGILIRRALDTAGAVTYLAAERSAALLAAASALRGEALIRLLPVAAVAA